MSEGPERERAERLEAENAELRRVNAQLMRERIGSAHTGAAMRQAAAGGAKPLAPLRRARLALRRAVLRVLR